MVTFEEFDNLAMEVFFFYYFFSEIYIRVYGDLYKEKNYILKLKEMEIWTGADSCHYIMSLILCIFLSIFILLFLILCITFIISILCSPWLFSIYVSLWLFPLTPLNWSQNE